MARKLLFKVATISINNNAFGLGSFIFMAKDGTAVKGLGNSLMRNAYPQHSFVNLDVDEDNREITLDNLSRLGFECPASLGNAGERVAKDVWKRSRQSA